MLSHSKNLYIHTHIFESRKRPYMQFSFFVSLLCSLTRVLISRGTIAEAVMSNKVISQALTFVLFNLEEKIFIIVP